MMKQIIRFWKLIFATFMATLIVICCILFFFWQELNPDQIRAVKSILLEHSEYFFCILFICFIVMYTTLEIIYASYIKPLKKISSEAAVIYASNPSHRVDIGGSRDIKDLSAVINNFADMFENLNKDITGQILSARKETEKERNLLAAIMSELPQGVFICNKNGRILLFNTLAKNMFLPPSDSTTAEHFIGLGRSVYHLIDKNRISHAIEEIKDRLENDANSAASYFITPIYTGHIISVETIPVLDQDKDMTGFILAITDISDEIHQYDTVYDHLTAFERELATQTPGHMMKQYELLSDIVLDSMLNKVPLTTLILSDFLISLKDKLSELHDIKVELNTDKNTDKNTDQNSNSEKIPKNEKMLADNYSFTAALIFLIKNLSELCHDKRFFIFTEKKGEQVIFKISWQSTPLIKSLVQSVLHSRMDTLPSFSYILKQNNAAYKIICETPSECSQIHIIASAALKASIKGKERAPIITGSRPEFYDFNLFKKEEENIDLMNTVLKDITYTVFDTETTGLNPDRGDEIVSIAAVRIVNNKIVYQDIFEELVDPKRNIPIESYKIHGISYEMVQGKNDIKTVLPAFKQFTSNTVLVGHNIAFDMKMFKVKEKETNIKFLNPVLDTLLLSAVLHPAHEHHDLENIAKRLGVDIIGRHTALGDTIATAQIFLKLLPILNSNGILTLNDAIKSSQRTYYARLKY